mgnify:CR=1 FL=1|tara:strand:- start:79054 stop:79680 length:627 start_codon:yes stop_codon:yes gene_type:complete
MKYGREVLQRALESKGYNYFENGDYNLNIIGIRNSDTADMVTNKFDDTITLSYKIDGEWQYHEFDCTTDPGTHYMDDPILEDAGTAILKPGQYPKSHKIRKHGGKYEALGQQNPVTVYRDNNRDDVYNMNKENTDTGLFGINIHRATSREGNKSTQVDRWSAGCQVIASNDDFKLFMKICRKARSIWSNDFTYTLLTSKDTDRTKTWI